MSSELVEERARTALALLKSNRYDLWKRFCEHEQKDEGVSDIDNEILKLFKKFDLFNSLKDYTALIRVVRRLIRLELGKPV
jgi:hypothetical protein